MALSLLQYAICDGEPLFSLKHFFTRQATVTINTGTFKSAEHFSDIVFRFFGNKIQRLILVQVANTRDFLSRAYWAESPVTRNDTSRSVVDSLILKIYSIGFVY